MSHGILSKMYLGLAVLTASFLTTNAANAYKPSTNFVVKKYFKQRGAGFIRQDYKVTFPTEASDSVDQYREVVFVDLKNGNLTSLFQTTDGKTLVTKEKQIGGAAKTGYGPLSNLLYSPSETSFMMWLNSIDLDTEAGPRDLPKAANRDGARLQWFEGRSVWVYGNKTQIGFEKDEMGPMKLQLRSGLTIEAMYRGRSSNEFPMQIRSLENGKLWMQAELERTTRFKDARDYVKAVVQAGQESGATPSSSGVEELVKKYYTLLR